MLKVGVLVPGGETGLQAVLDVIDHGDIANVEISVVVNNNPRTYTLERARKHGIRTVHIPPRQFPARDTFNQAFLVKIDEHDLDLIVLAGLLVMTSAAMTEKYKGRIINIRPSLIPSFYGVGYYGLKVHEAALARGVKVIGATVRYVDGGVDIGPIVLQKAVEVGEGGIPKVL